MQPVRPRVSNGLNLRVCPGSVTVPGLDVSHWNGSIDWPKVKAQQNEFAFMKASEGKTYIDSSFRRNWVNAKTAGLLRGAYHFFRPAQDVNSQVDLFLNLLCPDMGELPPVLDFEVHDGMKIVTQVDGALRWLNSVEDAIKRVPILYVSPGFMNDLNNPQEFYKYPLWVSNYGVQCPKVPPPWQTWTFWQDSEKGRVQGVVAPVDINIFNGSLETLKAL